MTLRWLHIQYKVNGRQQEVRPVGLRHERIYGLQSTVGQFQVVGQHDDGNLRLDLLDLSRDDRAIQKTEVVLEHNCIHGPRHEKPQSIATVGRGYQFVSVFLQQTQLSRIPVYAE
jgi:hypothetical protein